MHASLDTALTRRLSRKMALSSPSLRSTSIHGRTRRKLERGEEPVHHWTAHHVRADHQCYLCHKELCHCSSAMRDARGRPRCHHLIDDTNFDIALVLLDRCKPRHTPWLNVLDSFISVVQLTVLSFGVTSVHGQPLKESLSGECVTLIIAGGFTGSFSFTKG